MIWLVLGLLLLFSLIFVFGQKKKVATLNEAEEIRLPANLGANDASFSLIYAYLAAWTIKKNATNPKNKVAFVNSYFEKHFGKSSVHANEELQRGLKNPINMRSIAQWICNKMQEPRQRADLIQFLIDLSFIDGDLIDREYVALLRFSELIGVSKSYFDQKIKELKDNLANEMATYVPKSELSRRKALLVLRLDEKASFEEIKRSYRKLANRHHPDRFMDANKEKQNEETRVFVEIKEAYEYLMTW